MPRSAQTDLAILGALSIQPMTGYQLRSAIHTVLGHFWAESFGQIYPTLARLEEAGLVRRTSAGKTSGSVFELTADGRCDLQAGLAEPATRAPVRNGVLLRLFFGDELGLDGCRALLRQSAAEARAALATYAAIRAQLADEPASSGQRYRLMTLSAGEHSARAALSWANECLTELEG